MNIHEKLMNIQQELNAPKGQYNSFGKYSYRSCEDILTAVKPLLAKYKCHLLLTDRMEEVGSKNYITSNAILTDSEKSESVNVSASAREAETQKGMNDSQLTGSTSSYARKYALNGLFCIDDVKDSDATNAHDTNMPPMAEPVNNLGI